MTLACRIADETSVEIRLLLESHACFREECTVADLIQHLHVHRH